MKGERSQKEKVKAAMADFAAAYQNGQREKMAAFLAPNARFTMENAEGAHEVVGAAAASRSLEGLRGHAKASFGAAKIQLRADGTAWVEAKLESYEAADATSFGAEAHAQKHSERSASAHAREGHAAQKHEAKASAAGLFSAELVMHGEQWRAKQMHYRAE
jgi:ketosteroid isomerase-like protein